MSHVEHIDSGASRNITVRRLHVIAAALLVTLSVTGAVAGTVERNQALRMHERLAGVPPTDAVLSQMEAAIVAGQPLAAANIATQASTFYSVTLKNFVAPWSNREGSVFVPLNDYTATVIGMIRDDEPFNTLLSADILYVGSGAGIPPYSPTNNDHYDALEQSGADLKAVLVKQTQSSANGLPAAAIAGVITSRAAAQAFFIAGTNRAMFRFTLINHLCNDLEQVQDTSRPPDRIRQDVSRSPGGDSRLFLNGCIGCHSGMDPMAQAFAYYNYDDTAGRIVYTPGQVQAKYLINSDNFKPGYITPDDHWDNYWRKGPNQLLGWDSNGTGSGSGAKSLGQELASSDAFAQCQVEKVFKAVCFRAPGNQPDRDQLVLMKNSLRSNGYKLKQSFAEAAVYCAGN